MRRNGTIIYEVDLDLDFFQVRTTPEKKLLVAIIERAVFDYLQPDSNTMNSFEHLDHCKAIVKDFVASGMTQAAYAKALHVNGETLRARLRKGGYAKFKKVTAPYIMPAEEFLFSDAYDSEEWAFLRMLSEILPDPEGTRKKIRERLIYLKDGISCKNLR